MDSEKRRLAHLARKGHEPDYDPRYGGNCRTCNLANSARIYATSEDRRKRHAISARDSRRRIVAAAKRKAKRQKR